MVLVVVAAIEAETTGTVEYVFLFLFCFDLLIVVQMMVILARRLNLLLASFLEKRKGKKKAFVHFFNIGFQPIAVNGDAPNPHEVQHVDIEEYRALKYLVVGDVGKNASECKKKVLYEHETHDDDVIKKR
ncbi:hypothetical protein VNO77_21850 [Canavalia gladiata]|uniref:Uncharacterized protein n=1 Tax=Canavalia gladiata TaxID=3824 RepID=A0AAN9L4Z7_CANGL